MLSVEKRKEILGDTLIFVTEVDDKSMESSLQSYFDYFELLENLERRFGENYVKAFGMYKIVLTFEAKELIENE